MKSFVVALVGMLLLVSCSTTPTPAPSPGPAPTALRVAVVQQAQVGTRRVDPLLIVRPLIPPPPDSNHWAVLSFTNKPYNFTVYQRNSLLPVTPWIVATNVLTNSVKLLMDQTIASRFFKATANVSGSGSVTLAWNRVADPIVAGYNVYYGSKSGGYTNEVNANNATNITISGLISGVTYYFAATTYSAAGMESPFSSEVSYLVPTIPLGVNTTITVSPLPPAVAVLSATNVTATNAVVRGQVTNTGGGLPVTMFFYGTVDAVKNTNGYWQSIAIAGTSTNLVSAKLTNLVSNTKYYYVFAARNAAGLSITPADLSFTTAASLALLSPRALESTSKGPKMQKAQKVIPLPVGPSPTPPPLPPLPYLLKQTKTNSFSVLKPPTKLRRINQ